MLFQDLPPDIIIQRQKAILEARKPGKEYEIVTSRGGSLSAPPPPPRVFSLPALATVAAAASVGLGSEIRSPRRSTDHAGSETRYYIKYLNN